MIKTEAKDKQKTLHIYWRFSGFFLFCYLYKWRACSKQALQRLTSFLTNTRSTQYLLVGAWWWQITNVSQCPQVYNYQRDWNWNCCTTLLCNVIRPWATSTGSLGSLIWEAPKVSISTFFETKITHSQPGI